MEKDTDKMEAVLWSYELVTSNALSPTKEQSFDDIAATLASYLNELVINDFNKLISILYRIDVGQEKAVLALSENAEKETAGETLARLIIERQLQKIETRRKYRQ